MVVRKGQDGTRAVALEENALKELHEEMGLEARIVGRLGDYKGDTGTTRFFLGEVTGGDTDALGPETRKSGS